MHKVCNLLRLPFDDFTQISNESWILHSASHVYRHDPDACSIEHVLLVLVSRASAHVLHTARRSIPNFIGRAAPLHAI